MKQTTKNILGVAAIVLLSSGVAGLTAYKMLQKNSNGHIPRWLASSVTCVVEWNAKNGLPESIHRAFRDENIVLCAVGFHFTVLRFMNMLPVYRLYICTVNYGCAE